MCRPTPPTTTRSKRRSPRSRTCYARLPPGPRRLWWKRLVWHYRRSALPTLGASSSMPDIDLRVTYCETCCHTPPHGTGQGEAPVSHGDEGWWRLVHRLCCPSRGFITLLDLPRGC